MPYERCSHRMLHTLSGGEQKRLALEALLRGPDEVLLLDEPDNYLDVPGKRWLEAALADSPKTVLFVSHDRELLARSATRVVTIEAHGAWVHGGGFSTYADARRARRERLEELHRRWDEEKERLRKLVITLREQAKISPDMASRYSAMSTRYDKFLAAGPPPEQVVDQKVVMRLGGGRTGVRALTCERLELTGLMQPFDLEVFYGERLAVLGSNGSGKSHFLRLLAGQDVAHTGAWRLGARVVPGWFAQTHDQPELHGRTAVEVLHRGDDRRRGLDRAQAIGALRRFELHGQADQVFETLSGGQQARLQVLLLELSGCTMLLLDEPTDNLDLASAEALEEGLGAFDGTVVAVTHDRWFARGFDRFLVFGADGRVVRGARAGVGRGPRRAGTVARPPASSPGQFGASRPRRRSGTVAGCCAARRVDVCPAAPEDLDGERFLCARTPRSPVTSRGPGTSSTPRTSCWAGSPARPRSCCAASTSPTTRRTSTPVTSWSS